MIKKKQADTLQTPMISVCFLFRNKLFYISYFMNDKN